MLKILKFCERRFFWGHLNIRFKTLLRFLKTWKNRFQTMPRSAQCDQCWLQRSLNLLQIQDPVFVLFRTFFVSPKSCGNQPNFKIQIWNDGFSFISTFSMTHPYALRKNKNGIFGTQYSSMLFTTDQIWIFFYYKNLSKFGKSKNLTIDTVL